MAKLVQLRCNEQLYVFIYVAEVGAKLVVEQAEDGVLTIEMDDSRTEFSQLQNRNLHLNPRQTLAEVGDCEVNKFFHHADRCVRNSFHFLHMDPRTHGTCMSSCRQIEIS